MCLMRNNQVVCVDSQFTSQRNSIGLYSIRGITTELVNVERAIIALTNSAMSGGGKYLNILV